MEYIQLMFCAINFSVATKSDKWMSDKPKYQKLNQIRNSHHDIACNYALDTTTCVQAFWYECVNNNMSQETFNALLIN